MLQTLTRRAAPPVAPAAPGTSWPLWRRLLFRFTAAYLVLYLVAQALGFATELPLAGVLGEGYSVAETWLVTLANDHLFHIRKQLVPPNGSGDTSYVYAQLCLFTLVALVGTIGWSLLDRRRSYNRLAYWLLVAVRYFVAGFALLYGGLKLFGGQMSFPSLSQLATPLGDLLPMRFSWLFIGYSAPYQFFSGATETLAGVLLLNRRTATLGALVATGVFLNVMMLNLCYDIPVKLFSIHLFVFSTLLLLADAGRLLDFFVFNRPAPAPGADFYQPPGMVGAAGVLKVLFIGMFGVVPLVQAYQWTHTNPNAAGKPLMTAGFYEVTDFRTPVRLPDSLRWQNVVFESNRPQGSILTADTLFRQRYRRGYFDYSLDSARQIISLTKNDTAPVLKLKLTRPATDRLLLRGRYRGDSLTVALRRTSRHFQLAERQFHWLSEANR